MRRETTFLSKLLGIYCLLLGLVMLTHRQSMLETVASLLHDRPLALVLGVIVLAAGLAIILVHNFWSAGPVALVVTLVGWLTTVKGLLLMSLAPGEIADVYGRWLHYQELYYLYSALVIVLGALLAYAGYRPPGGAGARA